ncbi:hypothetical protein A8B83_01830 [Rhodobacteraceae bacterium EhC02]|jgi:hypothetical protein|nr:DUF5665 domain-containing protein [Paracoccaceae bacterium]OAN69658.1 hypothetical protein A8B83_01830 [Rhodobacteraceae bacterium EhC02]
MTDSTRQQPSDDQAEAMRALAREIERLNAHRFIKVHNSIWRLVGFQFLRGLAFGLGSVLGASILVSALAWWVSQFEFLPIIGEWASELAKEIDLSRGLDGSGQN